MKVFVIILTSLVNFISFSLNETESDSVEFYLLPDTLYAKNNYDKVHCLIVNTSDDTLLIINEFYLMGIKDNIIGWPMASYYYPNFIFFDPIKKPRIIGDGRYKINFSTIPSMLGIPPKSSINIQINISEISKTISKRDWETFGVLKLARKTELDDVVNQYSPESLFEFEKSIIFQKNSYVKAKSLFPKIDTLKENGKFNFMQDIFSIIVVSQ